MEIMKYPNMSGGGGGATNMNSNMEDVDFLSSSCWQTNSNDFMDQKIILDGTMSSLGSDKLLLGSPLTENEDPLEMLIGGHHSMNNSLAELKPLPPFTNFSANLSINGIQGHHYHAISQRVPGDSNNNYNNNFNEQNIVSSSTCNSADSTEVKLNYAESLSNDCPSVQNIKSEIEYGDISNIDDIAAIIGSAIADTTTAVQHNNQQVANGDGSRDSWMDLDAWIDGACVSNEPQTKSMIITPDNLTDFVMPQQQQQQAQPQQTSTLQSLLTHGYMPLLQNRLQNGPPIKQEPTSSNFDLISTSSPPSQVVSTTDNMLMTVNGRFLPQYNERIQSPDMLNYPHTTSTSSSLSTPKKSRNRTPKRQQQPTSSTPAPNVFQNDMNNMNGLSGKEKTVHRCNICNRGFLNKSNIKVHLRTHTGEKPFKCDTCSKAFRQKAHLLKHQQIHKRIGRD